MESSTLAPRSDAGPRLWALYYAKRGWPVIPLHTPTGDVCSCGQPVCPSPGKHPRTPNGLKNATVDPGQIEAWWKQWPHANVGIATGAPSRLVVLDIDPRNGGFDSFAEIQKEIPSAFKQVLKVRSGSGGSHYYFEHLGPALPGRANIRPGIDFKADGGYVVAPPSLHASGGRYRFILNGELALPSLPTELLDHIITKAQAQPNQSKSIATADVAGLRVSDAIKLLLRQGKPKGERSEAIFTCLRALVKAGHSDLEIVAVLMDPANGLSEKPRGNGLAWLTGEIRRARLKPDIDTGIAATKNAIKGPALVLRKASSITPRAINWLWPDRIALGKVSLLAGDPGLGKSQLTANIAATVSKGGVWPSGDRCDAGDVLFLSAEDDPEDTIVPRLQACGADLDRIHFVDAVRNSSGEQPLNLKRDLEAIERELQSNPRIRLVVIDPISSYLGGIDDHKNSQVRAALAPIVSLSSRRSVAVLMVTHLSKGASSDPLARVNGSIAFGAAVRTAFIVVPDKTDHERRLLLPLKSNIARAASGLAYRIEPHALLSGIETSRTVWDSNPVLITAAEALLPSNLEDADEVEELIEAALAVFATENARELPSSKLNAKLNDQGISVSEKRFKKLVKARGIRPHRRSSHNYYRLEDFVAASPSNAPSLHPSTGNPDKKDQA